MRLMVTNVRVCDSCEQLGGGQKTSKMDPEGPFLLTVCSEVIVGGIYEIGP